MVARRLVTIWSGGLVVAFLSMPVRAFAGRGAGVCAVSITALR
jgi:hypothetical protein